MKKIISGILVVSMVIGMLMLLPFMSFAEEGDLPVVDSYPYVNLDKAGGILTQVLNQSYSSAEEKIQGDENMRLCATYGQYNLYVNAYSGEVYVEDTATGNILTSNPYDVTSANASEAARREAMSQLLLVYHDPNNANSKTTTLISYTDAACHGQITVEPVKDGVRVNYILGNMTKRYALPASIPAVEFAERFLANAQKATVDNIRSAITSAANRTKKRFETKISDPDITDSERRAQQEALKKFEALVAQNADEVERLLSSYEEFAGKTSNQNKWSIRELYGLTDDQLHLVSWGNHYMFQAWMRDIQRQLNNLYPDYTYFESAVEAGYNKSDYAVLWSAYAYRSAYTENSLNNYIGTDRGGATRDVWVINYAAVGMDTEGNEQDPSEWSATLKDTVAYLREGAYEKEITRKTDDGDVRETVTCYPNSCFVLTTISSNKKADYERRFLNYATDFTMADAIDAETRVGYTEPVVSNATFRASLEYVLDENGLTVTLPAKSLVYDETKYAVDYISVLPYFGSAKDQEGGFIFYPDGSGAIIDFDDYQDKASILYGKVYGQDDAFYSVTGKHQQTISLPVYGTVHNIRSYYMSFVNSTKKYPVSEKTYRQAQYRPSYDFDTKTKEIYLLLPDGQKETVTRRWKYNASTGQYEQENFNTGSGDLSEQVTKANQHLEENADKPFDRVTFGVNEGEKTTGYLAILEEGASLATLYSQVNVAPLNHSSPFTSIGARFSPRQSDKYSLADVMDGAEATQFSIMAKGKYEGNYTIRYISLADETVANEKGATSYYPTTYAGMASAYRDYLKREGVLTALENLKEDLPLYIESFGVIQAVEKHLSIPVIVDVALTTFDNVGEMYDELKGNGISNIKFRLTGFANGGLLFPEYPVDLKWESAVGGKHDYKQLLKKFAAEDTGAELFPNFDFLHTVLDKNIKLKKYGARSVDNRYAWKQTYSAVYQTYTARGGIVISSDMYETAFQKFNKKYAKYGLTSLSLEAAANGLSSNFNEDNFIDRETALGDMSSFLATVRNSGYNSLMGTGGNAYALRYMDYLLEAPLESSHFSATSYAVPFWGMVMHGSLQYTGKAYNEQANKSESFLRAIESGASLYYLLSYDQTQLLKDTYKSDYYSVSYDITKDSMMADYKRLNDLLGGLQSYIITDHRGVYAELKKSADEIAAQRGELQEEFSAQLEAAVNLRIEGMKTMLTDYIAKRRVDSNAYTNTYSPLRATKIQTFIQNHLTAIQDYLGDAFPVDKTMDIGSYKRAQYEPIWNTFVATVPQRTAEDTIDPLYGKTIAVSFDRQAVLASALTNTFADTLDEAFEAKIAQYMDGMENTEADIVVSIGNVAYESAYKYFTRSDAQSAEGTYEETWSTVHDHTVVLVTYSDGTNRVRFLLNFNQFAVDVRIDGQVYSLSKYGYQKLD